MASTSGGGGEEPPLSQPVAAVTTFCNYLRGIVPFILQPDSASGPSPAVLEALEKQPHLEAIRKFLSDAQVSALLIERHYLGKYEAAEDPSSSESSGDVDNATYSISVGVEYSTDRKTGAAFIKRGTVVEAEKPIAYQLRVMNLSDDSPFEILHSYVRHAVTPLFNSFIKRKGDREGDKMVPAVAKQISELEVSLLHLQQNIDIPDVTLTIHPAVQSAVRKALDAGQKPSVDEFKGLVEDSTFLNALQKGVNHWIQEIQKVTKLDRDPASGTALQEVAFWLNLERALHRIQEKRESPEVTLTLDILKHGKRFHATVSFDADTGLRASLEKVNEYNLLMKDFPIKDLLAANDLPSIQTALSAIFLHLKKVRTIKYPVQQTLRLVEAISRDLFNQLLQVLGTRRLMHVSHDEFEKVMVACFSVFNTWDEEFDKLQTLLREIVKRKRDESLKIIMRINPQHKRLQARLDQMRKFRGQHDQLRNVIVKVLRPTASKAAGEGEDARTEAEAVFDAADANAIEEVNLAYEHVKEVDGLDLGKQGTDAWDAAQKRYDERIDRVEARITARLRDQLGTAKNANEMFRIFSRFNALFVRPHIRGAIREYQTQLIQRVKDDIESLHDKFKVQYVQSMACKMSNVRDLPPVSGSIIWARQIERQLNAYMQRVEDVLGEGWKDYVEGQRLKSESDSFRMKLNTQQLFEDWQQKTIARPLGIQGRIFAITGQRGRMGGSGNVLKLSVNFLPDIITLAKEVRNLKWLGFRVPLTIVNKAHQANQLYPFAISLMESVRTYSRTCERVEEKQAVAMLVSRLKKDVQNLIQEGVQLGWESYKLDPYVHRLSEFVVNFQEKVDELLNMEESIAQEVRQLETCQFNAAIFRGILQRVQKAVDELNLHAYSNLAQWVATLDQQVEQNLANRCQVALESWTAYLKSFGQSKGLTGLDDGDAPTHVAGYKPELKVVKHEIRITNQVLYLNPPVEHTRSQLLLQLHQWLGILTSLPRIQSSRYSVGVERVDSMSVTYRNLLTRLPTGEEALLAAYEAVEARCHEVAAYVKVWLQYQSLWDMEPNHVYGILGDDLTLWQQLLVDIRRARSTFDTTDTQKQFGPVVVDYRLVQSKVNLKYDSWHKDILSKFGQKLGGDIQELHTLISKSRTDLEQHSVEGASTGDSVTFITFVQSLKRKTKTWDKNVECYRGGQKILERQRFQFPNSWLYCESLDGEWSAFNDILARKEGQIQRQLAQLQTKIVSEDKLVEERTTDLLADWERGKPIQGNIRPDQAQSTLAIFEGRFNRLKEERDNLAKAKEALELSEPGLLAASEERMHIGIEELQDLKGVWTELTKIWEQLDQLKEQSWLSIQPRKIRRALEELVNQLKALPARLRQYASYEHVQGVLKSYLKVNMMIVDLKSEALKERHWKQLMRRLRVSWVLSDLTLGQLWDVNLMKNETVVKEVVMTAQGEMALEEFLKQVRESWQMYELDLINYQHKCKVIRGLEDLFNKVREHINSVGAMKLSPYFKVFEEDALAWEDKLNRINNLFEVWQDVQRRWVYLDGIFSGSADIKHLLPVETSRFGSLSTEFLALMKKVAKSPLVLDVLNLPGAQRSLERLQELLHKIQKALGEYLERERASFPRFYFVGDEDLLEIIGNSRNFARLQKHFRKMFAGVNAIILDNEDTIVTGLMSREGEEVVFETPISIEQHPKINDWLTLVEREMRVTLATHLAHAVEGIAKFGSEEFDAIEFMKWADCYEAQLVVLAAQIAWSSGIEASLQSNNCNEGLNSNLAVTTATLTVLADSVLHEQPPLRRRKLEHLITELVHQRDVTRVLINNAIDSPRAFEWLQQMRFYFDPRKTDVLEQLSINMANAKFNYGFEYLGVTDKLVQTPLTDRCYLTMTQALEERLGGSPFGPAGTGKTESVKALGNQLGRFVLVFNCDETFDFQAMGRIFVGLCQVGAWGCFDEFNRLEERMLSAVSQQIQTIQEALKEKARNVNYARAADSPIAIELVGKQVKVSTDMAIFITMNPGYAGRSNLPDNLKKLFRCLAMTKPDRQLIAQVMLYSQGFRTAEKLASKIVPFFRLCDEQLSSQSHYDFGLRALKSVLVSAGNVKRDRIQRVREETQARGEKVDEATIARSLNEQEILIQSVCETMVPKLVAEDIPLLYSLLSDVFPGVKYTSAQMEGLRRELKNVCRDYHLMYGESDEMGSAWVDKVLQLYQISQLSHGLMMVGPSGSGKSAAWRVLLEALERLEGVEGVSYVIDPKAISKEDLYGSLDPNTREWTDGLFTAILRKISDNVRGELSKRQWIIFDGDVDPEWVENLNSVLDDNKLLTLPNGERISVPPNVRIMFEVQDLKFATLATVSRCGMVWFSEDILSTEMICWHFLEQLRFHSLEEEEDARGAAAAARATAALGDDVSDTLKVQRSCATVLAPHFATDSIVMRALKYAEAQEHIMDYTRLRALSSLFSMVHQAVRDILSYNQTHPDFPLTLDQMEIYLPRRLVYCLIWSLCGDSKLKTRDDLGDFLRGATTSIQLPAAGGNFGMVDYEVTVQGEWAPWVNRVPQIEVETHKVGAPDVVVPTVDTIRHENLLNTWLSGHKPLVLCGPPGSGKTMTLLSALRALPDMEVVSLNFSSATTPELLLKTFDHYCEYKRTPNGVVLSPIQLGKWLILFCDEINLPDMDKYGTQRVISFIRQMVEHNGFWRSSDQTFVRLDRIQFVGACNPPTDPGRKPLSQRFLRHVPVVYVDYPGRLSLTQIYGTFNRAMLRLVPTLRQFAQPLTDAMVEFYIRSQERFTVDMQPHYIYSPREMTRWVRGIAEALRPLDTLGLDGLVRIWAHEALRLFQDRLVYDEERKWTDEHINAVAQQYFPGIDRDVALKRPILFSNWLSKDYKPVDREELRDFTKARLKVFYEEELDVPLVLFNEVLDHVLRIDRIFRQPQGHLLLIGVSGSGKTTLSRFVAWMNGLQVFQVKVHNKYTAEDFDEDLRTVLRRAGCKGEKICFIMDESNVLDSSFLERMNTLLANGEVPGLFEGDEYAALMTQCKEGSQRDGFMLDSGEELYKWFTNQIMLNLHVVFTMNPSSEGLKDRAATSPALFNRCVLNWFGDWSTHALFQVGREFTQKVDLEKSTWNCPAYFPTVVDELPQPPSHRDAVSNAFVYIHQTLHQANARLSKRGAHTMAVTPRHYLDFIQHYVKLFGEKRSDLEDQQLHLNVGLNKIRETELQVSELKSSLASKKQELEEKNAMANQKLKQMVKDQQEAEKKKTASLEIQEQLKVAEANISVKHEVVSEDLAKVEPAVRDAQSAVRDIKKNHLVEMRSMANPPRLVKMTLEAVCVLLGEPTSDWKAIRSIVMRENFITSIVNFSTESIADSMRKVLKDKFFSHDDFNYEQVNRSSRACGPLAKWAIAQVGYADMLNRVDPLRQELATLGNQAAETKLKAQEMADMVARLEKSIGQYKEEYAVLISEAQAIKADLTSVESKVTRSNALLRSLGSERNRWEAGSEQFKTQMSTIIGDVLLSAAFMAYAGYFDQSLRNNLFSSWVSHLQSAGVEFRLDIARTEYLSSPDDRLKWQSNALPSDDLCTENAIILQRFNRYPLIIDPSGQATEFILNQYKDRKISRTSFLDDSFRKNLESALRFGNPLLVQDVENYDPILNPVLNREVRRTGGRVLITLGDQDIDLSPSFTIILSTRDPSVEFPPDLCSRVTFVNFTVTPASLQTQCLNQVLKSERPDVDAKRSDLLKLQGEFRLRLRQLEKELLQALNDVRGKILDNDHILSQLEHLKKEAAEVQRKVDETDIVMAEVESVSQQYLPLATSCSSIFFMIDSLQQIHFLYQFSLAFFLEIFHWVLSDNVNLKGKTDHMLRLDLITKDLFQVVFTRVARSLLQNDRVTLALLLSRIFLKGLAGQSDFNDEFEYLLRGSDAVLATVASTTNALAGLTVEQTLRAEKLSKVQAFGKLLQVIDGNNAFSTWLENVQPERAVPVCWDENLVKGAVPTALYQLMLIQAFRPDRLVAAGVCLVEATLGEKFMDSLKKDVDLGAVVANEVKASTPVLLCSVTGYDASGRVDDLATQQTKQCTAIAIGSAEGFSLADKAILAASKAGRWVLLKNVHLAPQWLVQLEKKLHALTPHPDFRLFLTMEINPKVPYNLLRASRVFTFEPPPGVRSNLLRTFASVSATRMAKAPNERARLYFLIAWFHAIIQERLRYAPLGWSKVYEFNESDLRMACDTLDTWLDNVAQGRSNLPPDKIPWSALRTLISQCIYGGRIDNEFDQRLMNAFVNRIFNVASFESEFALVPGDVDGMNGKGIIMPDGIRREQFLHWVEELPAHQVPAWLGLPNNAEKVLLTTLGGQMVSNLLKMQGMEENEDLAYAVSPSTSEENTGSGGADWQPAWMKTLHTTGAEWLALVPDRLTVMKRTAEHIKNPLFRFYEREVNMGIKFLGVVRRDLQDLVQVCENKKKQTNYMRVLISDLTKGLIPSSWRRYTVPRTVTVMQWVADFTQRIQQLERVSKAANDGGPHALKSLHIWLGGLFIPEAFITASRQYVAQANSWPLEELELKVFVASEDGSGLALDENSFAISGFQLLGASCTRQNYLSLTNSIKSSLALTNLKWDRIDAASAKSASKLVTLPVYLNSTRAELLFTLQFNASGSITEHDFYEHGVAIIASLLN